MDHLSVDSEDGEDDEDVHTPTPAHPDMCWDFEKDFMPEVTFTTATWDAILGHESRPAGS